MSESKSFPERLRALLKRPPREIAMFFITSLAARGLGIVCQLLQVPIAIKALGSEAFGLWMAVAGLAQFIVFADLGMGIGLQNRLAESFATDTLADAVYKAYNTPLRADLPAGKVIPQKGCDQANPERLDCKTDLHMNFYAITLGTRGLQFNPDSDPPQCVR